VDDQDGVIASPSVSREFDDPRLARPAWGARLADLPKRPETVLGPDSVHAVIDGHVSVGQIPEIGVDRNDMSAFHQQFLRHVSVASFRFHGQVAANPSHVVRTLANRLRR
jgi:hypothetical protein